MNTKQQWIEPELTSLDIEETLSGSISFSGEGSFVIFNNDPNNPNNDFTRS